MFFPFSAADFQLRFSLMSSQNNLEIKGSLSVNPLAELLTEIAHVGFDGSLRLADEARKAVVYFNAGQVVFAVSNLRQHRLAELISTNKHFNKPSLPQNLNAAGDLELAKTLTEKNLFSKQEIDGAFNLQIAEILKTALDWQTGEWIFSPLVRVKENMRYKIDLPDLLIEHARNLPKETIVKRFRSFAESFGLRPAMPVHVNLSPQESFVLSRFEHSFIKVEEVKTLSGLSDPETLKILYILWLGGFLYRQNWNAAFSDRKISDILNANLSLKKEEDLPEKTKPQVEQINAPTALVKEVVQPASEKPKPSEPKISLDEYLEQTETAANHYETLGVALKASAADIKRAYFAFAKQFHPDLFYRSVEPKVHQRIQSAFTKVAQAYDTLRVQDSREAYDFKLRRESDYLKNAKAEKSDAAAENVDLQKQAALAAESFDTGFNLLMEEHYEEAIPFLARAVHLANDNARYHAFYGKALSFDENQRFKAEAEMQLAIKLESKNAVYRIILAEFFIYYGLVKRAEGELRRLLAVDSNNREALALLDSLRQK